MRYFIKSAVFFFSIFLFISCGKEKKQEKELIRPVLYKEVQFKSGGKSRTFSGVAKTDKIVNLSFRSSGIITQFSIKLGQKINKGQLLAKLDNVQARLNYENSVSSQNSAASQMNTAKLSLNRVRSLYEKGSASLSDFEAAKNSFKTAQQSYNSSKRSVAIQQEQIKYGYLYAPETGIIASVAAEVDENISAGQNIAVLNAGTDMEIELGIPENVINQIKQNMEVAVEFSSVNNSFKGKVTEIAPSLDKNTATYPVRVLISNPSEKVKSGMTANVTFDFKENNSNSKQLIIPANAVGEDSKGRFVFLVEGDKNNSTVKKQYITIGDLTTKGFEVVKGLSAKQKIATAGLQTLLDGQKVQLQ